MKYTYNVFAAGFRWVGDSNRNRVILATRYIDVCEVDTNHGKDVEIGVGVYGLYDGKLDPSLVWSKRLRSDVGAFMSGKSLVVPVVTLKSSIRMEKDANGVWQLTLQ